jgi:beta-galactosidase
MDENGSSVSRRSFLKTGALVVASAAVDRGFSQSFPSAAPVSQRLLTNWEHFRGSLAGPWEVWNGALKKDWQAVSLPHCFNALDAVDPDSGYYRGQGWYRTKLKVSNPFVNGRTILHFEGAGQKTAVFVGLDQVVEHVGGYDEFFADITPAVNKVSSGSSASAEVPITIVCDNAHDLDLIPSDFSDFNLYGGIYRYLNLEYFPAISIERLHVAVDTEPRGSAKISIRTRLYNPEANTDPLQLTIHVVDPRNAVVKEFALEVAPWQGERELAVFLVEVPQLWSPANPALYRCDVKLSSRHGEATASEHLGIRYFEFAKKGPFYLNGSRLLLRGTQRHEDHAGLGSAMPEDLIRREMTMIKQMGANFIRLGHYQQSRVVLDLCDELGLLVWEEIPWCRSGVGGERWKQLTRGMLRNMIDQHFNHPSVILWGLGNENDWPGEYPEINQLQIRSFLSELNDASHKLDPTRATCIRRCDFCKDIPDVYSPSIWAGWYRGRYTDYRDMVEKEASQVDHFLHIEWGGDSQARRHSEEPDRKLAQYMEQKRGSSTNEDLLASGVIQGSKGDWSETFVCNLFDWHLKEQEGMPSLTGSAQWAFKDFSTPLRPENPVPRVNQKGLVERDLTPKEGYYVFQSYWSEEPMAHIYGHTWPVRWGQPDEKKLIKVYSNCETAELFVNGKSQGLKKRNPQDFPAAGFHWLVLFNSGNNHLQVKGRKNGRDVVDEIAVEYVDKPWGKPARLELREKSRSGDRAVAEAILRDERGSVCLDSRDRIFFRLAGDGALVDNQGTNRTARVVELCNGRAEITVIKRGGRSVVSAASSQVLAAFVEV